MDALIRRFEASDVEPVISLIHKTIDESYAAFYSAPVLKFFKGFHSEDAILKRNEQGDIWILERGSEIVGTGATVENEIYGVFVSPASQRTGFGRLIMEHLEEQLRKAGHRHSKLSISLPSRTFYESMGYKVINEVNREVDAGHYLRFWKAEKQLVGEYAQF
ncbi:GNAT family N-acetyltransferase [Marinimicrobium sp. ABcell2]|uniref:GNAT family N-acetyltransferase n=1 Tax=Marinimicrobium sp. ABcell2 TaxID=3069751 RepID=UPI0027B109FB|nr:GNAT family N-acetyltransferase [Marinimicrobium sp. ABcell2]MDQ2076389.1 GNAT family N-acetyltransferase [Marinimicrobium sp. ABcell2]